MLYKKYHRNFVRQFKKGVKFRFKDYSAEVVEKEPWYENDGKIRISGNKSGCWILVFSRGIIKKKSIYVV